MNFFNICSHIIIFLSLIVLSACAQTPIQKDNHSIAIILKINGEGEKISAISIYNFNLFNAHVKNEIEKTASHNSLFVKIKDDRDSILFESYVENPLTKGIESFSEEGIIEKVIPVKKEDFINLRFKLPEVVKQLTISCYQTLKNEEEKLISTFNLKVK